MTESFKVVLVGDSKSNTSSFTPLSSSEMAVLVIISAAVILFGVYPKPILDLVQNDVQNLVHGINFTHP